MEYTATRSALSAVRNRGSTVDRGGGGENPIGWVAARHRRVMRVVACGVSDQDG